ncbi:hypothetical protein [Parasphingorhabdus sp.]|uniref:hypothetical protein n=1 Tax=Parasphingorhabdus sp. TaxID=2709688 RepID=UPI003592E862
MQERWETWPKIQHLCGLANVTVSKDQLERWRLKGLLPKVNQVGRGRGAGSETRYPIGTANQAIAIIHLLSVKEKLSFVGWQLWMRGCNVDERYWKPEIDNAIFQLKRMPAYVRLMETRYLTDEKTLYDQIPFRIFQHSPFAKGVAKLSPDMQALSFSLLGEVAKGNFTSFASLPSDDPKINMDTISKFIGLPIQPIVAGIFPKIDFEVDFELQLSAISNALRDLRANPSITIEKLTPEVRIEFLAILAVAENLQMSLSAFRKSPIGRFANSIAKDQKIQAFAIVLWSAFREMGTIQSNDEIMELAKISNSNSAN